MHDVPDRGTSTSTDAVHLGFNVGEPVSLSIAERRLHVYVTGKTGTGKSTLLLNLMVQDLQAGRGFALLDPHGDLAERVLDHVPPALTNRVVYLDPNEPDFAIGLNILEHVPEDLRPVVAAGVLSAMKHIWSDSWGPRLAHFLLNTILALMDTPGSTLLGVPLMLLDADYRRKVVARVTNPVVRQFFEVELPAYPQHYSREAMGPVLNKIQSFLVFPTIRNIIGQERSTFDMRRLMDENRYLIANLSKGLIGEEPANLLGSLLVTNLELTAMRRASIAEHLRPDFALYADEFHSFSTSSFATLLSEARKYRLSLIGAHQYLGQLTPEVRAAVLGNVGTMVVFRVGAEDGRVFEQELLPITLDLVTEQPAFHAWLKLPGGAPRMSLASEDCAAPPRRRATIVKAQSRRHYARKTAHVEGEIAEFLSRAMKATKR